MQAAEGATIQNVTIDATHGHTGMLALEDAHIQHTFEVFKGDHLNRVASQLEVKVLPMFSRTLEFEAAEKRVLVPVR